MARPPKWLAEIGLPPMREYWREINRHYREAQARERAKRKAHDKRRRKCRCEAYPWPHRPGGGLCRYPHPPVERWHPKPGGRPYRERYAGLRRQIARANGLHPIKDRAAIEELIPGALELAKVAKQHRPRMRYREVEITATGVSVQLPRTGPEWGQGLSV